MKIETVIRVLHVRAGADAEVIEIEACNYHAMQALVGGLLDVIGLPGNVDLWVHDEALCQADPILNFLMMGVGPVYGDVFFARHGGDGETLSLTDADIAKISALFAGRSERRAQAS